MTNLAWRGIIAMANTPTQDGRVVENIDLAPTPMPLLWRPSRDADYSSSRIVGKITAVRQVSLTVYAWGVIVDEAAADWFKSTDNKGLQADMDRIRGQHFSKENILCVDGVLCIERARLVSAYIGVGSAWSECFVGEDEGVDLTSE